MISCLAYFYSQLGARQIKSKLLILNSLSSVDGASSPPPPPIDEPALIGDLLGLVLAAPAADLPPVCSLLWLSGFFRKVTF